MRILMVHPGPSFSVADVFNGWKAAFEELGCEVYVAHMDADLTIFSQVLLQKEDGDTARVFDSRGAWEMSVRSLYAECYRFWPDLIFNVFGMTLPVTVLENLKRRGHRLVTLFTESPYEDVTQLERAAVPDLVMVNDPSNLDAFREVNREAYYQPHCYDPRAHCPGPAVERLRSDFAFVGTGYSQRVEFFESVNWDGIEALFGGYWRTLAEHSPLREMLGHDVTECCDNDETVRVYRSTKMSANIYRAEGVEDGATSDGWAMGPREIELAATGVPYLTEPRGENREVLPMVPTFTDPGDFSEQLRWWLAHDRERDRLSRQARALVADRTFINAASTFLQRMERLSVPAARGA